MAGCEGRLACVFLAALVRPERCGWPSAGTAVAKAIRRPAKIQHLEYGRGISLGRGAKTPGSLDGCGREPVPTAGRFPRLLDQWSWVFGAEQLRVLERYAPQQLLVEIVHLGGR